MKKFIQDFKAFATKGNVIDMAVGVVVGGAFGKIVTSLVNDIITPLIGVITGGTSLADKKLVLHAAELAEDGVTVLKPENALTYGMFLQNIIDFLIIALSIFMVIRMIGFDPEKSGRSKETASQEAGRRSEARGTSCSRDQLYRSTSHRDPRSAEGKRQHGRRAS